MNNVKLSARLGLLLNKLPKGCRLADIGSDHALLPIAAVESGKAVCAIAGEVNPGPFEAASKAVAEAGAGHLISVRRGDGLEVLEPGEADCITIAGMGGALISAILERGRQAGKLTGVSFLALQPNVGEDILRAWLYDNGWVLASESILEEDGKIYELLTAVPAGSSPLSNEEVYADLTLGEGSKRAGFETQRRMGPWLLRQPNAVFAAKWRSEIAKLEGILQSLSQSELSSAALKREEIQDRIEEIKEVLACLPKDKP